MTRVAPQGEPLSQPEMIVLSPQDYAVLGAADFGAPGLTATEIIGPFVELQAVGPLIMVHDAVVEPNLGIGHHPHRFNERLFYILEGSLSHDDALNQITGFMGAGDVARLTEGETGMLHKEWNDTGERTHAFILVYETRPVPERASFAALRDADAPRYEEAPGVETKELVGARAGLDVNGDIRFFADSRLQGGSRLTVTLAEGEGALLFPLEGDVSVGEGTVLRPGNALIEAPTHGSRQVSVSATTNARLLRVVHGPGRGIFAGRPLSRHGA
jgi:redox-sensitive bicupin YhaK (pirin superfamily)